MINTDTNLLLAPLSLVRGGNYHYLNGTLDYWSYNGYYWSRLLRNAARGYYLYFSSGGVSPQNSYDRGYGFALRCLGRQRKATERKAKAAVSKIRQISFTREMTELISPRTIHEFISPIVSATRLIIERTVPIVIMSSAH